MGIYMYDTRTDQYKNTRIYFNVSSPPAKYTSASSIGTRIEFVCMYACMYIYVYIYTYTYTHIIHRDMLTSSLIFSSPPAKYMSASSIGMRIESIKGTVVS